ncbi:uncharacterized protein LOC143655793 [Tamandua tetradactyla]|uniref:uncharacterized protein LOC143655793 n=1 Tax=Tamandua tetradactyla TaxID=48850 RepID=UPI00405390A1
MSKFNIRKGLDRLTAESSSATLLPPPPPAPSGSREPEIAEMLQASTSSSSRKHCGSSGARARLISWSHVPFSQGDFHCWMSFPMKRERSSKSHPGPVVHISDSPMNERKELRTWEEELTRAVLQQKNLEELLWCREQDLAEQEIDIL